ncbi:RHS repeat-associated core domain-containing protein [Trinickia diaoshuihuensis]|uniref:RHS repeat-associated core domain-containing protein n=1 Tax=Trinickia diaoshuihuensis TaxID=2292265 RepID=UPI001F078FF4|nr:RHS repeat-associated core domain-containing protein [Trinickia diaoshuihuensis]
MSVDLALGYAGERPDRATAGYPLGTGYRWYMPSLMRFNAADTWSPFGRGGINPYGYCAANPITRIDPSGHTWGGIEEMDTIASGYSREDLEIQGILSNGALHFPTSPIMSTPTTTSSASDAIGAAVAHGSSHGSPFGEHSLSTPIVMSPASPIAWYMAYLLNRKTPDGWAWPEGEGSSAIRPSTQAPASPSAAIAGHAPLPSFDEVFDASIRRRAGISRDELYRHWPTAKMAADFEPVRNLFALVSELRARKVNGRQLSGFPTMNRLSLRLKYGRTMLHRTRSEYDPTRSSRKDRDVMQWLFDEE